MGTDRRWRRPAGRVAGALLVVLAVPALGRAQGMALFPNATIKRQRVSCMAEDPIYRIHRQQYYGYYPTCWRQFPPGWGFACAGKPVADTAATLKELDERVREENQRVRDQFDSTDPTHLQPDGSEPPTLPDEGMAPAFPPLPAEGSDPFDLDAIGPGPGEGLPEPPPPAPGDLGPGPRPGPRGAMRSRPSPLPNLRSVEPPPMASEEPGNLLDPSALPPLETSDGGEARIRPTPPPAFVPPLGAAADSRVLAPPAPVRAPQRRTLLGGLFGGSRARTRR